MDTSTAVARDPAQRRRYLDLAERDLPRLLSAIDRNPFRRTYGCLDRNYWHYRTASFPSEMYQEGVLGLALAYTLPWPNNPWFRQPRVRELAVAALRFSARAAHADGSCDDYYPYERALGAAVFSLQAGAEAYRVLELNDDEILSALVLRARWVATADESGNLTNHHALAALALARVARIAGLPEFNQHAAAKLDRVLAWQNAEGWFDEYGGADPGYQTVTIDCLAKYQRLTGDARIDAPLRRAVEFARHFLHPDDSYAGEYGSRGTYHFYPHGLELLAAAHANAADLADGFLGGLARGAAADFSDDRLFAHRTANWMEAWRDWSASRPAPGDSVTRPAVAWFPNAQILIKQTGDRKTIVSAARGGIVKQTASTNAPLVDAGLLVETTDGRIAVSQSHDLSRQIAYHNGDGQTSLAVAGPLHWARFETMSVIKQMLLYGAMITVGRWCRTLVRRLLQKRLITGRAKCGIHLERIVSIGDNGNTEIVDRIELRDPRLTVRRLAFGSDHQAAYVAASGVFQEAVLCPWNDLSEHVAELNANRCLEIRRRWPPAIQSASE